MFPLHLETNVEFEQLISLAGDGVLKIWDLRTNECMQTVPTPKPRPPDMTVATPLYDSRGSVHAIRFDFKTVTRHFRAADLPRGGRRLEDMGPPHQRVHADGSALALTVLKGN